MTKAQEQYEKVKNCVAFNIQDYVSKVTLPKTKNEEHYLYKFDDKSQLTVIKSISGPFENGSLFKFIVW